jgi:hypothetical protein
LARAFELEVDGPQALDQAIELSRPRDVGSEGGPQGPGVGSVAARRMLA